MAVYICTLLWMGIRILILFVFFWMARRVCKHRIIQMPTISQSSIISFLIMLRHDVHALHHLSLSSLQHHHYQHNGSHDPNDNRKPDYVLGHACEHEAEGAVGNAGKK